MSKENRIRCDYLMKNDRSCLKVGAGEGEKGRKQSCSDRSKDLCCRLCDSRKECQIVCAEVARLETEEREAVERERARLAEAEERRIMSIRQDIENFVKAGRYEDAAQLYEKLGMWENAGECRRLDRTSYLIAADVHIGTDGISVNCPKCGSPERLGSRASEVICKHCGSKYFIPKKILDLI